MGLEISRFFWKVKGIVNHQLTLQKMIYKKNQIQMIYKIILVRWRWSSFGCSSNYSVLPQNLNWAVVIGEGGVGVANACNHEKRRGYDTTVG